MTSEEQIFALMAAAETQQKESQQLLDELRKELAQLATTRQALAVDTGRAARSGVMDALANAPAEAGKALSAGSLALANAANRADSVAQRLGWQTFGIVAVSCFAAVLGALALGMYVTPTPSEIAALRTSKAGLEANLAALDRRGGRIKLTQCGEKPGRLCVEIDESAGRFGESGRTFWVLKGY